MEKKKFDFESFAKNAADELRSGKPMVGRDGVFTPLLKMLIEGALNGEMDAHMAETRKPKKNRRNGHTQKTIQSPLGGFEWFSLRAIAIARSSRKSWKSEATASAAISINKSSRFMVVA